jgi:hypothetical protein
MRGTADSEGFVLRAADLAGNSRAVLASLSEIELFDISPDGRVLLGGHTSEKQTLAFLAGFAEPRAIVVPGEASHARSLTRGGTSILVVNHRPKDYETYLVRSDRPGAVRLCAGEAMHISPDGSRVLVVSADARTLSVAPIGAGESRPVPLPEGSALDGFPAWLPDGKRAAVILRRGVEPTRAFVCDVASGTFTPFALPGTSWGQFNVPPVSPDGRFIVLHDPQETLRRWPLDGGAALPIPGLQPGDEALAWSDDGAALFVAGKTLPIPVFRLDLATGARTPWLTIAARDSAGLRTAAPAIDATGKYWTLSTARLFTDLFVVDGLR